MPPATPLTNFYLKKSMSEPAPQSETGFSDLGLPAPLLRALNDVGYETPSPIQAQTIPPLLQGKDVLGQAQTGTGKTAAFALPILARIDLKTRAPQVLVLAPTRELAIQVAEAFQKYAAHLPGFRVLPIYGGQHYTPQLQALRRGAHVVVGTPGRVIDHMERRTLKLNALSCLVLDEADEMLRMGFIEDVEKVLESTPPKRQVALFSATMPAVIRRIAQTYLNAPAEITIRNKTSTVANTRQRYLMISGGVSKLDALTRILEAEPATDVAARGLDVDRISHVINYDVPTGTESYVHRIGRTGRAGRKGEAILFVMPRERHMLRVIERATRQSIEAMELPSAEAVNEQRLAKLKDRINDILSSSELASGLGPFRNMVKQYQHQQQTSPFDIAAALGYIALGETPLLSETQPRKPARAHAHPTPSEQMHSDRDEFDQPRAERPRREAKRKSATAGMETYRIEVGHQHGVKPANIVGAISNEAQLQSRYIGQIEILSDHSLIELPEGMPKEVFDDLKSVWVAGQQLRIGKVKRGATAAQPSALQRKPAKKKPHRETKRRNP